MRSHAKLHFDEIRCEILEHGHQKKHYLNEGYIITRLISFYFALVEVVEYNISERVLIDISVAKPIIFMVADLNNSSCNLGYCPPGNYKKNIFAGKNSLIVITFREDWFVFKCKNLPEFKTIISSCDKGNDKFVSLKPVSIATNILSGLKKFESKVAETEDGYFFINGCLEKYYKKLKNTGDTKTFHKDKAACIAKYIAANFTSPIVDDVSKISEIFMVSERSLARIARIAFGKPLHEQVIKFRIEYAIELLLTTDRSIKEISLMCGYNDPYYFSKAFKKYTGETPKSLKRPFADFCLDEIQK